MLRGNRLSCILGEWLRLMLRLLGAPQLNWKDRLGISHLPEILDNCPISKPICSRSQMARRQRDRNQRRQSRKGRQRNKKKRLGKRLMQGPYGRQRHL